MSIKKIKISVLLFLIISSVPLILSFDDSDDFETLKNLTIFHDIIRDIKLYYVDDKNTGEIIRNGIDKMLENLDPYTNYYPESEIVDYTFMSTGTYGGIGAVVVDFHNKLIINEIYKDFPADKAKLKVGDEILSIDDHEVNAKNYKSVKDMLLGESGTTLILKIKRYGMDEPLKISIKRENVKTKNISYFGTVKNDYGYIKLSIFMPGAAEEVKNAFTQLKEKNKIKGLILDLRDNPGGLLIEAVNIVNLFVDKGNIIVYTKGKNKDKNETFRAIYKPVDIEIPIIVLVNSSSASASEIVSGALQDLDRAVIIGQRTFGKGLVQNTLDLSYNSKLKITIAKYYIPSGRCIQSLDYTNRNSDGSVGKIPDSLISRFKTLNGRIVYDGGGISPDINLYKQKINKLTSYLTNNRIIFNFVTTYISTIDSISKPNTYNFPEKDYPEFIQFVLKQNYNYQSETEKASLLLDSVAVSESIDPQIQKEIKQIKTCLKTNTAKDLLKYKNEIQPMLEDEITERFYYQSGKTELNLRYDESIKKAIEIFGEINMYNNILTKNN